MGLFRKIFSNSVVIKKAADGLYNGVDKAIYTNEEKAEGFIKLLGAYKAFAPAQRLVAIAIVIPFVLAWGVVALMLTISGFVEPAYGQQISTAAFSLLDVIVDTLGIPVVIVVAFLFGGNAAGKMVNRIRGKPK